MKTTRTLLATVLLLAAASLPSCTAEWGADLTSGSADYYYYDSPFYSGPYYSGTTYPYYWGTPGPVWTTHVPRPGGNAWTPVAPPAQPVAPSRPGGNIRPGNSGGNSSGSILPPAGTIRPGSVSGGQPGIAMPPEGSGLTPAPGRH